MQFFFRMQTLLNWKRNLEEFSQMRLAEKIRQLKAQEEKIQQLIDQRFKVAREVEDKAMRGIKVDEYSIYQLFGEDSYIDLLRKKSEKKQTEGEIEAERESLIGLMKERKILERLKEKRYKKFIYQMEKLDQKSVDEIAVMRRSLNSRNSI